MAAAGLAAGQAAGGMASAAGNVASEFVEAGGDIIEAVIHELGVTFRNFTTGIGPLPPHDCAKTQPEGYVQCRTCRTWLTNWREQRMQVLIIIGIAIGIGFIITKELADALAKVTGDATWGAMVGMPFPIGIMMKALTGGYTGGGGGP